MNTVDYPMTADQLRASIESIFYHLGLQFGEVVKSNTYSALAQKQQAYFGESFVEQMEKNVIYMDVLTMQMEEAAASYLCTGQPLLHPQEVAGYIESTCILPALKTVPLHLKFIREGCTGCEVHYQHGRYSRLADLRLSGNQSKYVETLEQSYVSGHALQQTTEIFLNVLLENQQFSGIAKYITHRDTLSVIDNRTRLHSSLWLGHFEFLPVYLFSVELDLNELDRNEVSTELRKQFREHDWTLTSQALVEVKQVGNNWAIVDGDREYLIRNEDQTLNVYLVPSSGAGSEAG